MTWHSTIFPLLLLINAGVALIILQTAWQRRHTRGALPFCWMVLAVSVWSFAGAMELLAIELPLKVFWSKVQYFGIVSLPILWLLFAQEYAQIGGALFHRRAFLALLWLIPVITILLALTNEWHDLIWSAITPLQTQPIPLFRYEHGAWFWVFAVYGYAILFAGTMLLVIGTARFSPDHRRQALILLIGAAIPWVANLAYLSGWTAAVGIDVTPIAFCLTSIIYALQVFRFQLFDLIPIAQDVIVESMSDGIIVLDLKGRISYINPTARQILKADPEIGKTAAEALPDLPLFSDAGSPGAPQVLEIRTDEGTARYYDIQSATLDDRRGRPSGRMILIRDVTAAKREEGLLRAILDAAPYGMIVIDRHGSIAMANAPAEQMLGYQPGELNARPLGAIVPARYADASSMIARYLQDPLQVGDPHGREVAALCKDGRELPVEITLNLLNAPTGLLILATLRDLSRQKAAEEQINQQSVALAAAASAIVITDREGWITWVNPAFTQITGYSAEEAIGKKPSILKSGFHDQKFYAHLWQTILAGENWRGELTNRRKDGSLFIEEATIAPVRNARGEITHFIAIKQDITKRKELEGMRDELMQTIVHDLRNPLTSILFALDMIKDQADALRLPPEMAMMLAISRDNSWRMLGMVNAMLDYSRLESGKLPLQREPITLAEMVEQSFRFQSQLAARRELLLLNDVPYDLPPVLADRTLISRVLQNLIDNAIKYAPQGSNITIKAQVDAQCNAVRVVVHDDGPGVAFELRDQLFQKFASERSERGGTGLGLAFCRLAIEAHKGQIWVESEEGRGTDFIFTLPLGETPEKTGQE
jgi:PAS domain S-box-containing protein